jgi:hypothetical protein
MAGTLEEKLEQSRAKKKEQLLFEQVQKFVDQVDSAESLEHVTASIQLVAKMLGEFQLPEDKSDVWIKALDDLGERTLTADVHTKELVRAMKEMVTENLRNTSDLVSVITNSPDRQLLGDLKQQLTDFAAHLQRNEEAQWQFDIDRDSNGDMKTINVKRLK